MASALAKPPIHRQNSRPNSASSSSVVTVQRAPSFSARNTSRNPVTGLRSQSPLETLTAPSSSSALTLSPETSKRRSSAFNPRSDSGHGFREGVGNLNRWSQSTTSSKGSSHKRGSSLSKRLSGSFGSFGNFSDRQTPPTSGTFHKGRSPSKKSPSATSNMGAPPLRIPPNLPPIVTLNSLSQAVDAAESPSTATTVTPVTADILTPAVYKQPDYFGDRWQSRSASNLTTGTKRPAPSQSPTVNGPSGVVRDQSSPGTTPPGSMYSPRTTARLRHTDRRRSSQITYHRNRDDASKSSKGSGTTEGESSASDSRARVERPQKRKAPSQKAMLSKALQKAHHAVTLDQHSNYEGAMHAYEEACALLQKVMIRSSGVEDRLKLDAVRNTYEARIVELRNNNKSADGKALPQRPPERDSQNSERLSIVSDTDEGETASQKARSASLDGLVHAQKAKPMHVGMLGSIPPRRQSLQHPSPHHIDGRDIQGHIFRQERQPQRMRDLDAKIPQNHLHLETPMHQNYMPPPLSPRRPLSPDSSRQQSIPDPLPPRDTMQSSTDPSTHSTLSDEPNELDSVRQDNGEHTSWLNTINESSGDSSSSVHSRRSSVGLRRKHIRAASGQTEAEFDAALDAAIETAYDDGFEPDDEEDDDEQLLNDPQYQYEESDSLSSLRKNVELAKESARDAEREAAVAHAKEREKQRLQGTRNSFNTRNGDDEDDEEERMLEEMTRDYILDDAEYDIQTKSALPRQSDSSGFSGRTWGSSIGSNPTSAGTSLSTVAEVTMLPSLITQMKDNPLPPPIHPPPSSALPPPPAPVFAPTSAPHSNGFTHGSSTAAGRTASPGVRERRLSSRRRKPLKIDTSSTVSDTSGSEAPKTQPSRMPQPMVQNEAIGEPPKSALPVPESQQTLPSLASKHAPLSALLPGIRKAIPMPGSDSTDVTSSTASALTKVTTADSDNSGPSVPGSPARFNKVATGLRKNFSSSSLRNQNLTVVVPDAPDNASSISLNSIPSTPRQRLALSPAVPVLPTPLETSFITKGFAMGGIYLFDNDIHSPNSPGSPNPLASNAPQPLEPCPEATLLRPFWFLRSVFQTIANPRGGYISSKLFVPRDIWRVKNIKLKSVEEKVSSCDLLTAALLKLGKVDTYDANAVLEEMQFFETVMEQVQSTLTKKLGSDVGVQGSTQMFKGVDESLPNPEAVPPKPNNANSKYLSWRKLRSKTTSGSGPPSANVSNVAKDGSKEGPTMKSLPMTSHPNPRFPKRDINQVQCVGPNPSYMGALARLCDASQILDQITRQVEDPGLKHSSQTHVGLELSARHASEFFAFFICRFVFTDIGMMLDKFIKRGSEWVLA